MNESQRPDSQIARIIKNLLNKTIENGCSEAEAAHAYSKAMELLTKHNIKMDQFESKNEEGENFIEEPAIQTGRWLDEMNMAFGIVKRNYFIEGFLKHDGMSERSRTLYMFGTETNVSIAKFVFNSLIEKSKELWLEYKVKNGLEARERRAYITGVMSGFDDKLKEDREILKRQEDIINGTKGGTELAIRRINEVTKLEYKNRYKGMSRRTRTFAPIRGSRDTMEDGYKAGKNLNINREINGSGNGGIKSIE